MCVRCGACRAAGCLNGSAMTNGVAHVIMHSHKKVIYDLEDQILVEFDRRWAIDHLASVTAANGQTPSVHAL